MLHVFHERKRSTTLVSVATGAGGTAVALENKARKYLFEPSGLLIWPPCYDRKCVRAWRNEHRGMYANGTFRPLLRRWYLCS